MAATAVATAAAISGYCKGGAVSGFVREGGGYGGAAAATAAAATAAAAAQQLLLCLATVLFILHGPPFTFVTLPPTFFVTNHQLLFHFGSFPALLFKLFFSFSVEFL